MTIPDLDTAIQSAIGMRVRIFQQDRIIAIAGMKLALSLIEGSQTPRLDLAAAISDLEMP